MRCRDISSCPGLVAAADFLSLLFVRVPFDIMYIGTFPNIARDCLYSARPDLAAQAWSRPTHDTTQKMYTTNL